MGKLLTNMLKAISWKTKPKNTCGRCAALYLTAALYLKGWYSYLTAPLLLPVAQATTQRWAAISEPGCFYRAAAPPFSKAQQRAKQGHREGTRRAECDRELQGGSPGAAVHTAPRRQESSAAPLRASGHNAAPRRDRRVRTPRCWSTAAGPGGQRGPGRRRGRGGGGKPPAARKWGDPCRTPPPPGPAPFALSSGPGSPRAPGPARGLSPTAINSQRTARVAPPPLAPASAAGRRARSMPGAVVPSRHQGEERRAAGTTCP